MLVIYYNSATVVIRINYGGYMALSQKRKTEQPPQTQEVLTSNLTGETKMPAKEIKREQVIITVAEKKPGKERAFQFCYLLEKDGSKSNIKFPKMALTQAISDVRNLKTKMAEKNRSFDANDSLQQRLCSINSDIVDHLEEVFPLVYNNSFEYFNQWFPEGESTKSTSKAEVAGFKRDSQEYKLLNILNTAVQYLGADTEYLPVEEVVDQLKKMLRNDDLMELAIGKLTEYEKAYGRDLRSMLQSSGKEVSNQHYKLIYFRKPKEQE
jgi:hypothetical protein